jgi:hypothetical protein
MMLACLKKYGGSLVTLVSVLVLLANCSDETAIQIPTANETGLDSALSLSSSPLSGGSDVTSGQSVSAETGTSMATSSFETPTSPTGGSLSADSNTSDSISAQSSTGPEITIISEPGRMAIVGQEYTYQASCDGDLALVWFLAQRPAGMTLTENELGAVIHWTPEPSQLGDQIVEVRATASDPNDKASASQRYLLTVGRPPKILSSAPIKAVANFAYTYIPQVDGSKPYAFTLLSDLLAGMSFNPVNGEIVWTPTAAGTYNVIFLVKNPFGQDSQIFDIQVVNDIPLISSSAPEQAYENVPYRYEAKAAGTAPLTWSITQKPLLTPPIQVDPASGIVFFTPGAEYQGQTVEVSLVAQNSAGHDSQTYRLTVFPVAPKIISLPSARAVLGQPEPFIYQPEAVGMPPLAWELLAGPTGMTIDPGTGLIQYVPDAAGSLEVTLRVSNYLDGTVFADSQNFHLEVIEPVKIVSTPPVYAAVKGHYQYQISTSGTGPVSFSLLDGPPGLELTQSGRISYVPDEAGVFVVSVAAVGPVNTFVQAFTIRVRSSLTVSPAKSLITTSADCLTYNGFSELTVTIQPRDNEGANLPPVYSVELLPSAGQVKVAPQVTPDGSYEAVIQADRSYFVLALSASLTYQENSTSLVLDKTIISATPADSKGGTGGCSLSGNLTVTVIDAESGLPIEDAFIIVGADLDDPFPNNLLFSDENGRAVLSHPALQRGINVSIGTSGYEFVTILSNPASDLVIPLRRVFKAPKLYSVSGNLTNTEDFPAPQISWGFVSPLLGAAELLSLNPVNLLAPTQNFEIPGGNPPLPFPGNVAIPKQSHYFVPIELPYLIPLWPGNHAFITLAGLSDDVDMVNLAGSSESDPATKLKQLIAIFSPRLIGISGDFSVDKNITGQTIDMVAKTNTKMTIQTVKTEPEYDLLGFSLLHNDIGSSYAITDVGLPDENNKIILDTTTATDTFAAKNYGAMVTIQKLGEAFGPVRTALERNLTVNSLQPVVSKFLLVIEGMTYQAGRFSFNDILANNSNPASYLFEAFLGNEEQVPISGSEASKKIFIPRWRVIGAGDQLSFRLPQLPADDQNPLALPKDPFPLEGEYGWMQRISALDDGGGLNFSRYTFDTYNRWATAASTNYSLWER